MNFTRDELIARLVRAGVLEVAGGDQAETDSYFDTEQFRFHGPGDFEADYIGLRGDSKGIWRAYRRRAACRTR